MLTERLQIVTMSKRFTDFVSWAIYMSSPCAVLASPPLSMPHRASLEPDRTALLQIIAKARAAVRPGGGRRVSVRGSHSLRSAGR